MNSAGPHADDGRRRAPFNLHLHHLAYLREVARTGNLTRAAEALHMSQPALSQAIAELERRIGHVLFLRHGRRLQLTAPGQDVLAFADEVLQRADALARHLTALTAGEAGTLRIGMIDAAGLYLLPDAVRRYRTTHPNVDLQIAVADSGVLLDRLRAFDLDLVFVVGPVDDAGLAVVEVEREPLYVYAPAGTAITAEASADARWLLYPRGSRTRALIDEAFGRAGVRPAVALESHNPQVLRQMVAMGMGWSVLPPAVAGPGADGAGLAQGPPITERAIVAAWPKAAVEDPRRADFLALVHPPPAHPVERV
jgi:DNA-binding transcriptional LysR family regulator